LEELRDHLTSLRSVPIVVIHGTPGVGKTVLAVHLAHQLKPAFPGGQLYANLRGADVESALDPGVIVGQFLLALGVKKEDIPTQMPLPSIIGPYWIAARSLSCWTMPLAQRRWSRCFLVMAAAW
jgi:hypothetical protein